MDRIQGQGRARILTIFTVESEGLQDQEYLAAILKPNPLAFDLNVDAFFLSLQKNETISLAALLQRYDPKYVLLCGCRPKDIGLRLMLPDYEVIRFQGRAFLKVDSLHQIRTDREKGDNRRAGALWKALKEMFA